MNILSNFKKWYSSLSKIDPDEKITKYLTSDIKMEGYHETTREEGEIIKRMFGNDKPMPKYTKQITTTAKQWDNFSETFFKHRSHGTKKQ